VLTQIYGLTTVDDAVAVDRLRPDHVGIVVDEGIDTWDLVDEDTALAIAAAVRHARVVALSLSTAPDRIAATADLLRPAVIHLARAHLMAPGALAAVRERVAPAELMLTVPVIDDGALDVAARLGGHGDWLLLDSSHPGTGVVGATGLVHDWTVSARIVAAATAPVVLAGGLGPRNVADAIRAVGPAGVDSETRTSRDDDRRRKDLDKVEAFLAAVASATTS
jgi:phosphoribosylanthranilate isomerase